MIRREREILKASVSWTEKVLTVKEEKAFQAGAELRMRIFPNCTIKEVELKLNK